VSSHSILLDRDSLAGDMAALALIYPICRELSARYDHPLYRYKPDDHKERDQLGFHRSAADVRLLFGGNQSGKSRGIAQECTWWLTNTHPYLKTPERPRLYCLSNSYRTIQEGVYKHLNEILPTWLISDIGPRVPAWNFPAWIRMKTGAQIDFISGEGGEEARRKVQAAEVDLAIIDEEVIQLIYEELQARRLSRGGKLIVGATLVRSEPWCMDLEDRAEMGDDAVALFRLSTYIAAERGHVSSRQLKEMESTLSAEERDVRLRGKSRRAQGRVYPEFSTDHIIEPFTIPREWTRYCALDPGFRTFAVLWAAVAPDQKYVLYRELYYHGQRALDVAEAILAAEGYKKLSENLWAFEEGVTESIEIRWIDPSAFRHDESGNVRTGAMLSMFSQEMGIGSRLSCSPAPNDVTVGIEYCRRSLQKDIDGIAKLRVFKTCREFINEARHYRFRKDSGDSSRNEVRDQPVKRRDHLMDCLRYMELGGLNYQHPPDPRWTRKETDDKSPEFFGTYGLDMQERLSEHWQKLMRRQVEPGRPPAHPGGLGDEY
jgi:hypothetical protein